MVGLLIDTEQKYLLLLLCDILGFPCVLIFKTSEPIRIPLALKVHNWDVPACGEPAMSRRYPLLSPSRSHPPLPSPPGAPDSSRSPLLGHSFHPPCPLGSCFSAWLCISAPQLLPVLTSLRMDSRPVFCCCCCLFIFEGDPAGGIEEKAETQESDQVGGVLSAVILDWPTPGSFGDGP